MLLVLTPELRDELPRVLGTSQLRDALSNLARAHREGTHILSGPATLLSQLGEARALPEDVRGTFKQIKLRVLDAASLRERVSHFAVIEPREGDIQEEEDGGEARRCFRVPLAYFSDSARTQASRLVAEDSTDAGVYERAAEAHLRRLGPKGLSVRFQSYGGGGDSTADALRDHARQGPTVCVVDADYKWSSDEGEPDEGATAANARKVARRLAGKTVCTVYAVPCREIENLLPRELVLECFVVTDRGDFHQRCVQASELGLLGGGPRVDRLDLKKGLCRKDYEDIPNERPEHRYLARVFAEHRTRAPKPARGWCADERRCTGEEKCECVLFMGLGDGLVARVADKLETLRAWPAFAVQPLPLSQGALPPPGAGSKFRHLHPRFRGPNPETPERLTEKRSGSQLAKGRRAPPRLRPAVRHRLDRDRQPPLRLGLWIPPHSYLRPSGSASTAR